MIFRFIITKINLIYYVYCTLHVVHIVHCTVYSCIMYVHCTWYVHTLKPKHLNLFIEWKIGDVDDAGTLEDCLRNPQNTSVIINNCRGIAVLFDTVVGAKGV